MVNILTPQVSNSVCHIVAPVPFCYGCGMGHVMRGIGWAWLLLGIMAVLFAALANTGAHVPLPPDAARAMATPWSGLIPVLGLWNSPMALLILLGGVVINASMLLVIAKMLRR